MKQPGNNYPFLEVKVVSSTETSWNNYPDNFITTIEATHQMISRKDIKKIWKNTKMTLFFTIFGGKNYISRKWYHIKNTIWNDIIHDIIAKIRVVTIWNKSETTYLVRKFNQITRKRLNLVLLTPSPYFFCN